MNTGGNVPADARPIGFVDCYSGASGDMLLGALVDVGVPLDVLREALAGLAVAGEFDLTAEEVARSGIRATKVHVRADEGHVHRPYRDVAAIVRDAGLTDRVRERALAVLGRLAAEEGRIHGASPDAVELHEVGAIDSIVDVVGTVVGFDWLGIDELGVSSVPISTGAIASSGHRLPAPAPATLAILAAAGIPTRPFGEGRELVTPTGAALLATLGRPGQPAMIVDRIGYGAGDADLPWPNVLRLWVGHVATSTPGSLEVAGQVVMETNIDDMTPQLLAPAAEALLGAGALDVTMTAIQMKKGRPGITITVIARGEDETRLARLLLTQTTTLGVRAYSVRRHEAERSFATVETPFGSAVVKRKILDGRVISVMPEFESVRSLAKEARAPIAEVHGAASAAARALLDAPDSSPAPGGPSPSPTSEEAARTP